MTVRPTIHGTRLITPGEAASLPDNSSDYENFAYSYDGLEDVKSMLTDGKPLAFVAWHHGASSHAPYAIARVLPETALFTRKTFQLGKIFTYSMLGAGPLSLVKMARFLEEGRPVRFSVDGPPLGHTVRLPVLGIKAGFSTGPVRVVRIVEGLRLIPVTCYYADGNRVDTMFHPPTPAPDDLAHMSERDVLTSLLTLFEQDLRARAPEQVMWWFMAYRERLARHTNMERAFKRRKMF